MNPTSTSGSNPDRSSPRLHMARQNRSLPDLVCILIVALMMGCFAFTIAQVGRRLDAAWDGSYLVGLAFLVALEALLTARLFKDVPSFSPEWFAYRIVEWVVLLVGIRLYIFVWQLPEPILQDTLTEGGLLPPGLITLDTVIGIITGVVVWALATQYASALQLLEYDADRLDTEREGIGMLDRGRVRKQIVSLVFTVGCLMLAMTALQRLNPFNSLLVETAGETRRWYLLVYFLLGLLLLGITNFNVLRSRWHIQRIPLAPNLSRRWILVSSILLGILAGVVAILPTRYAVDILAIINILIGFLTTLLGFLYLIILAPMIYLLNLLLRLIRPSPVEGKSINPLPALPPPPPPNELPVPWLDMLWSIVFWVLLIGVVGFSLYHYAAQRKGWVEAVRGVSLSGWLEKIWRWFRMGFGQVNRQVTTVLSETMRKTTLFFKRRHIRLANLMPSPVTAREKVIQTYQALVHHNQETDVPRFSHHTPQEYGRVMLEALPDVQPEILSITETFIEARYSQHPISSDQADQAVESAEQILRAVEACMKDKEV